MAPWVKFAVPASLVTSSCQVSWRRLRLAWSRLGSAGLQLVICISMSHISPMLGSVLLKSYSVHCQSLASYCLTLPIL